MGFASRTFSLPFQLLTEKGAVGVLLYAAVFCLVAREAHRQLRRADSLVSEKLIVGCLFAGLAAVLARELTYSSLLEHTVTALLAAASVGLICIYAG